MPRLFVDNLSTGCVYMVDKWQGALVDKGLACDENMVYLFHSLVDSGDDRNRQEGTKSDKMHKNSEFCI
jgi:hypothetical protein